MKIVIFNTQEATFRFDHKSVMERLERRKLSYDIQELDTLIDVISSQPDQTILSSAENPYFGFIALELINSSEGSGVCETCGKKYNFNQLEAFTVGPDDATFRAASTKKGGFKNLFRKKLKPPGMYGGKGYRCPRGHILIYMQTWTS
jgi:hypothetical protein